MHYLALVWILAGLGASHVLVAPRDPGEMEWRAWREKHSRRYATADDETAGKRLWEKRRQFVIEFNQRKDVSFTVEMNQFADRLRQPQARPPSLDSNSGEHTVRTVPPESFDWRTKGVISPVKNQGIIGSADSVAAEECAQSLHAITSGKLLNTSFQEVTDCCRDTAQFNQTFVFDCIHRLGGICSQKDYPTPTGHCHNNTCQPLIQIKGGKNVEPHNPDKMVTALLQRPLLVYVDASIISFQLYHGGIYQEPACSKTYVDHAMQLVGYGEKGGDMYWILKNSWSVRWGLNGYMLMKRGTNECGVETYVSYPY